MEPADKLRLAKAAAPILFSTSGVSNPLQDGGERQEESGYGAKRQAYEDPEDDYLASALAKNAASAAVTVGKAMYPAVKQIAVDMYPAVKEAVVESTKAAYASTKEFVRSEEQIFPRRNASSPSRNRGIEISIGDAVVREDRILSKHVVYSVRGHDSSGTFDSFRRYSDFVTLRSSLLRRWPGIYIPAIPPKQTFVPFTQGNTSQVFIDDRRVMLEDFLRRLVEVDVLMNSDEFQVFIRGTNEFDKECAALQTLSFCQIAKNYGSQFGKYAHASGDALPRLEEEEKFMNEASTQLKVLKDVAKQAKETYSSFQLSYNALSEQFQWIEDKYLSACLGRDYRPLFRGGVRSQLVNPYGFLYDWLKCELLECRATVETIGKVRELEGLKKKYSMKLEADKQDLQKLQLGKTLLSHVLTFKSRSTSMVALEKEIEHVFLIQYTPEVEALSTIIRIVSARLLEYELPRIKSSKETVYSAAMRKFAQSSQKEFEEVPFTQLSRAFKGLNRE